MYETTWRRRAALTVAVFAGLTLFAAACGSETATETDTTETASAADETPTSDEMADDDMSGEMADDMDHDDAGDHNHTDVIDVPDGMAVPEVAIRVEPDPKSGHNLFVELENFEIAPERASTEPVDGEGHLHLYIDGERQMRFYNTEIHLEGLTEGDHEIAVEVSANNHSPYALDGTPIRATTSVTVEAPGEHDHTELSPHDVASADAPSVTIEATPDPKSGWNLHFPAEGIDLVAEAASTDHVDGQGHMHLYVDGVKVGRMYGEWWHLASLTEGEHEVMIELNGNDHAPYAVDGAPITATTTISVSAEQAAAAGAAHDAMDDDGGDHGDEHGDGDMSSMSDGTVIDVVYRSGDVEVASDRVDVPLGSEVTVQVTSDVAEELHVHGYDLHADVGPDLAGELSFTADVPGLFEIELEGAKLFLFELAVG